MARGRTVGLRLGLTWDEVDRIMGRAVARGLARREESKPTRLGLDETSLQKCHEYVRVVTDLDRGCVVAVLDGRTGAMMDDHFSGVSEAFREAVEVIAMDMWRPYLNAARKWLPNAKACFDRFHVAQHLGDAVNTVRKEEHRRLLGEGDRSLMGTKCLWLESPRKMRRDRRLELSRLKAFCTRTGRAWAWSAPKS